ncbi:MAG: hypothetical protein PVH41_18815, partial [Anaerolineae bacterium]
MSRKPHKRASVKERGSATKPMPAWIRLRSIVTIVLLLFVGTSVVYLVVSDSRARGEKPGQISATKTPVATAPSTETAEPTVAETRSASPAELGEAQRRVIAYYFHGTARCATCRAIEQYAYEALVTGFSEELESGMLEWRPINVEEAQ